MLYRIWYLRCFMRLHFISNSCNSPNVMWQRKTNTAVGGEERRLGKKGEFFAKHWAFFATKNIEKHHRSERKRQMASKEATGQLRLTVFLTASESRTTGKPQKGIEQGDLSQESGKISRWKNTDCLNWATFGRRTGFERRTRKSQHTWMTREASSNLSFSLITNSPSPWSFSGFILVRFGAF